MSNITKINYIKINQHVFYLLNNNKNGKNMCFF